MHIKSKIKETGASTVGFGASNVVLMAAEPSHPPQHKPLPKSQYSKV